ncbi:hypothetical protein BGX23_003386 [Mortierella sp. AD031]|nr:hypothetical protein BGX23_003386 [Mortierella sp. AD031]
MAAPPTTSPAPPKGNATTTTGAANPAPTTAPVPNIPMAFLGMASATGDGQIFYHGGQLNKAVVQYSNELYSLDVTKPWQISNPAWTNLTAANGGPAVSGHSATMSTDLKTLYLTAPLGNAASPFWYKYNVQARTWTSEVAPAAQANVWANRREAQLLTDPATNAIWYLGGSVVSAGGSVVSAGDTNEIDRFMNDAWNANIPTVREGDSAGTTATMGSYSSGTSHLINNRIYFFGGFASSASSPRTYQTFQNLPWLDISTSPPTIGSQLTLGAVPPPRQDHCSVMTSSKKIVIYGGYDSNSRTTFQDLWSLDLVTLTWQQVVTVNPTRPRYSHTCNIVGANMIVFGGRASSPGSEIGYIRDIQVYDVMQSSWMTSYAPKQDTTPVSEPLPGGVNGPGGNHSGLSMPALIGIIVGSVALLGCVAGVFIYRRRQRKIEIREAEMEKEAYLASLGTDEDGKGGKGGKGKRYNKNSPYGASASSPYSASTRHLNQRGVSLDVMDTPATTHYDPIGLDTPVQGGGGNVQYLMQQLPDGTIAVQPVYLDHQPVGPYGGTPQLQQSPNIMYSENSSLGGVVNSPTPTLQNGPVGSPASYFAPPPPAVNSTNPAGINPYGGAQSSAGGVGDGSIPFPPTTPKAGYVLPPSSSVPYPRPVHGASGVPSPMLP